MLLRRPRLNPLPERYQRFRNGRSGNGSQFLCLEEGREQGLVGNVAALGCPTVKG